MKRLLAFLILASCAIAGTWMASPGAGSHGGAPVGPSFLLDETFEGTGWPSGWWGGATADPDNTTSPIVGSQDMLVGAGEASEFVFSPTQGTIYLKFRLFFGSLPGTFTSLVSLRDSAFGALMYIQLDSSGVLICNSGSIFEATSGTLSTATNYYVWVLYSKGTGANAVARVWFSTTDTKPADGSANSAGATNGNLTTDVEGLNFNSVDGSTIQFQVDNTQAATTDF